MGCSQQRTSASGKGVQNHTFFMYGIFSYQLLHHFCGKSFFIAVPPLKRLIKVIGIIQKTRIGGIGAFRINHMITFFQIHIFIMFCGQTFHRFPPICTVLNISALPEMIDFPVFCLAEVPDAMHPDFKTGLPDAAAPSFFLF